jgi:hypothetical protein
MNSMAQQAVPNGIGQIEDLRPHLIIESSVVVTTFPRRCTPGYVGSTNLPLKRSRRPIAGITFRSERGATAVSTVLAGRGSPPGGS